MPKIINIEFLRIICCFSIVLYHFVRPANLSDIDFFARLSSMCGNANKAVDLFFILSGFFLILGYSKIDSLWAFFKKKLVRLYPAFIFAVCLCLFLSFFKLAKFKFFTAILTLFGFSGTILSLDLGLISPFWYVSAMLWTMFFMLYLLKNYERKNVNLFFALAIIFSYGFIINVWNGSIGMNLPSKYGLFHAGMLRALGGMSIGYFIAEWYKANIGNIKQQVLSIKSKLTITAFEAIMLFLVINNLLLHKSGYKNQFVYIIIFTITIVLFLINKGYVSKFLNKNIFLKISRYTYSIFVTHIVVRNAYLFSLCKTDFIKTHPCLSLIIELLTVLILGIFTYHFIEKPASKYYLNKLTKED